MMDPKVVIVGAGISGLTCARHLQNAGVPVLVLEKAPFVGGRIKSTVHQGFILDEGFQVLLDSYPELRSFQEIEGLELKPFPSGARLVSGKISGIISNPYDSPWIFIKNLLQFPLRPADILVLWSIWMDSGKVSDVFYMENDTETTRLYLQRKGVRQELMDSFFRPFFGGVFLDPDLETGSQYFLWLFRKFGQGRACLPKGGMARFPQALSDSLLPGTLQTGVSIKVEVAQGEVWLDQETAIRPEAMVLATGTSLSELSRTRMAHTLYLKSPEGHKPFSSFLWLNGNPKSRILHLCFPDQIQPGYAPDGASLCAISILPQAKEIGEEGFRNNLLKELISDFPDVNWSEWNYLAETRVPKALPKYGGGSKAAFQRNGNVWEVGDVFTYPSINGAMESGRKAAEDILRSGLTG